MTDNGAEDTSNVTGGKGDHQLFALVALSSWLWYNMLVEGLDGSFKSGELHHGVWNLTHPQWGQALVETAHALLAGNLWETFSEGVGETWLGLDSDLNSLEWSQTNIGKELSTGTSSQVQSSTVDISVFLKKTTSIEIRNWILVSVLSLVNYLSHDTRVEVLKSFIETEFTDTLNGVTNQSWGPSLG